MRRRGALIGGLAITAALVAGQAGPAPAQVPDLPDVDYVDGFGPGLYSYADCTDVVYIEEDTLAVFFIELDETVEVETQIAISFGGSLAGSLVETPATATVVEDDNVAIVEVELVEFETGDLSLTVEQGIGYTAGPEDTITLAVTDEVIDSISCRDDLSELIDEGKDRQTIDVGETPEPLGFFEGVIVIPEEPGTETTESTPPTTGPSTTSTTTTEVVPVSRDTLGARLRTSMRAVPEGFDTPVVGTLPPGLTYVDDEWGGTATTAGTYAFDVRLCFDQGDFEGSELPAVICFGTVDVVIEVEADAVTPPPATPVRTDARFTG